LLESDFMRICYICNEYPPGPHGGVGSMVRLLARALVEAGHEARVIGLYSPTYPCPSAWEDRGVQVTCLREPQHRLGWMRGRYQLFRQVQSWTRRGEIDLVEAPDSRGWFAGWPGLPVPLVQRAHGSYTFFAHDLGMRVNSQMRFLESRSYARTNTWVAASSYTAELTRRVFGLRQDAARVLYNAVEVDMEPADFEQRHSQEVVFTGTLVKKKGVVSLIDAWPLVAERHPEARLQLYGKDGRADDGRRMSEFLTSRLPPWCTSSVTWHGHVDKTQIDAALRSASVAVFPSYSEAFGLAPAEAMACGCPTIYTRLGPGPEIVRDEVDGLLVDPDEPRSIAEAIHRLLDDRPLAERLADAGRKRVTESFSLARILPENLDFYAQCLAAFHN
jgi:glycosyltransferase involved in cell wall biosynthesis